MQNRILVAEDDICLQDIFESVLTEQGYAVEIVTNGLEITNTERLLPDLYLLDRHLSPVDGVNVCQDLKSNEKTKAIPIILISADSNVAKVAEQAGADDYIEKPFTLKHFLEVISRHLTPPNTNNSSRHEPLAGK